MPRITDVNSADHSFRLLTQQFFKQQTRNQVLSAHETKLLQLKYHQLLRLYGDTTKQLDRVKRVHAVEIECLNDRIKAEANKQQHLQQKIKELNAEILKIKSQHQLELAYRPHSKDPSISIEQFQKSNEDNSKNSNFSDVPLIESQHFYQQKAKQNVVQFRKITSHDHSKQVHFQNIKISKREPEPTLGSPPVMLHHISLVDNLAKTDEKFQRRQRDLRIYKVKSDMKNDIKNDYDAQPKSATFTPHTLALHKSKSLFSSKTLINHVNHVTQQLSMIGSHITKEELVKLDDQHRPEIQRLSEQLRYISRHDVIMSNPVLIGLVCLAIMIYIFFKH